MSGLSGLRVLVTRPRAQAASLVERLQAEGAIPILFPTVEIGPGEDPGALDQAIRSLPAYRWIIFTSVNGVDAFWQRLQALGEGIQVPPSTQIAAIGPATANALREHGIEADLVPTEYIAEAILPGLGEISGQRILLPRADIARKDLFQELLNRGALPEEISAYRTLPAQPTPQELAEVEHGVDIATFTSSSTLRNFVQILGARAHTILTNALIACIGPITASTAREFGYTVHIIAEEYTSAGLVNALLAYYQTRKNESHANTR